jgi:hypothetical protein
MFALQWKASAIERKVEMICEFDNLCVTFTIAQNKKFIQTKWGRQRIVNRIKAKLRCDGAINRGRRVFSNASK